MYATFEIKTNYVDQNCLKKIWIFKPDTKIVIST